jgi:hypothetical protein
MEVFFSFKTELGKKKYQHKKKKILVIRSDTDQTKRKIVQ